MLVTHPTAIDARRRARFRDGDPEAVRAVYAAYGRLVYAVAYSVLAERGLAEEATQQTFLKAWRAAASVDPTRELGPWLATIAKRVSLDIYRRETRRPARPLEAVSADDPALITPALAAEDACDIWEVRRAVSLLPDDEREVVRAQHFEGLTHEQIATKLGIPAGTVKSRSYRAHRRLAAALGHLRQPAPVCQCA
ncbi:MAG TPA: sigma-70 family RNA polymerase sigma factor [Solirubrobacteraceae bacterium]|nr:sigma-70 family RNA polymerase sigma factor [Solirubrobacteraceae bacterium]